ncbi:MAG: hypothetical protein Q4E99_06500 [Bacillota bacterium]|nr:hypothetical protein [Bacillota bacterium]
MFCVGVLSVAAMTEPANQGVTLYNHKNDTISSHEEIIIYIEGK